MPNDDGYVLDFESVQRIGRMLRNYERGVTKPGMTGADGLQLEEGTTYVEVTGAATSAGYYPGCEKFWDMDANIWRYAPTPCVVWEINGSTLEQGKVYKATLVTNFVQGGAQKNVFAVQASGGGGGGSDVKIFLCGNQDTTNFPAASRVYTASFECSWNVANNNFECAGLSQLIRLADVNRVDLVAGKRYIGNYVASKTVAAGTLKIYAVRSPVDVVSDITCLDGVMTVTKIRSN